MEETKQVEKKKKEEHIIFNIDNKVKLNQFGDTKENMRLYQSYEDKGELKWAFRGYHQTVKQALEHVIRNEMLVDYPEFSNIGEYVTLVEESNKKLCDYLEELK